MDYPFSSGPMEDVASGSADNDDVQGLVLENSFGNVAEHMSFDAYAGWCNSTSDLSDQMFPTFVSSPITVPPTIFSPFDGLNFTNQYSSGISIVDDDITGNSFISGDKEMFHHTDKKFPFATDGADEGSDLIETREKIHSSISRHPIPMQSLADKMLRALYLFKQWSGNGILAQLWVPLQNGDRYILSTCEQPYLPDQTLSGYREVSRSFTFATEIKPGCFLGLPGRVFVSKIPEWTSNVLYYNKAEFLRAQHAVDHEVRGSIALPVFEDDSLGRSCCAVLELVTMEEKPNFDLEMENVCRALEAVNLRSVLPPRIYPQIFSKNQKAALAEIADVLRAICFAHQLPLALTWIPCSYIEGAGDVTLNLHSRGKSILCLENTASYVNDKDMVGFVHACEKHYLEQGQGIVGKSLQSNQPFFNHDVKEYDISEYPLVHHARKFGLNAAVAIRLRSVYTGNSDYILEFFLPVNTKGRTEQQFLLNNLSSTMQKICKSLRTLSDAELHLRDSKDKFQDPEMRRIPEISLCSRNLKIVDPMHQDLSESTSTRGEVDVPLEQIKPMNESTKQTQKKRGTTEKHVSLSVLQQYFPGSLSDAAKSIGVCKTTLKRICRQYGISRWPSRKIHKVNRSLKSIQTVLDSVQGVEGGLKFDLATGGFVSPNKNDSHLLRDSASVIQNSKSETTPSEGNETTIVKSIGECLSDGVENNQSTSSNMTNSSMVSGSIMNDSSSSSRSFCKRQGHKITAKVTYKEDTVRFKFKPGSGYLHLHEEVGRRFKLQVGQFQLKYLDDEDDWVMLVNDSDFQECLEILDSAGTRNVRFMVRDVANTGGTTAS